MKPHLPLCLLATATISGAAAGATVLPTAGGPVSVGNWGYQLQGPPAADGELLPGPLAAAPHDLVVVDYARFGDDGSTFTPAEVAAINNRSGNQEGLAGQRRISSAYVSIGEASEFRSYWDASWTQDGSADSPLTASAPSWLGPVNPDFPESRKVRYWDNDWQDVIFNDAGTGYLDRIVGQGFDSAYLDIVDAYFFWGSEFPANERVANDPTDGQDAARRMIDFVVTLTEHARETNPDFFVIPQNGAFILNDADFDGPLAADKRLRDDYLAAIGGIGVEDVYFGGDADEDNPFNPDEDTIAILQEDFFAAGKPVFAVDYLTDASKIEQFEARALADGFLPYVANSRDLDTLSAPSTPTAIPEPVALSGLALLSTLLLRRTSGRLSA